MLRSLADFCRVTPVDMERRLTAILAADLVGYSRLMGVNENRNISVMARYDQASSIRTNHRSRS